MTLDLENYQTTFNEASEAFNNGELGKAFQSIEDILRYPGHPLLTEYWQQTFELFAKVSKIFDIDEFTIDIKKIAKNADDIQALYQLGYNLIEWGLPHLSSTLLTRANTLAPGHVGIIIELVGALEQDSLYAEACRVLRAAPQLVTDTFICRYLLAFNSIMTGDLVEPQRISPSLQTSKDEIEALLGARIANILQRAELLKDYSTLDGQDLRGWHYVLTDSLLLHISTAGFNEGMNGRYAYVQDSYSLIREGIERLISVLDTWEVEISQVFVLPDENSRILAHAIARILACPVVEWNDGETNAPGLVVAYDLGKLESDLVKQLHARHSGQFLWSHAICWTKELYFAADFTTYLYQFNTAPWDRKIGLENTDDVAQKSKEELIEEIVNTTLDRSEMSDLDSLLKIVKRVKDVPHLSDLRLKQDIGSPVPSSRFL
jgi:hypothetical protein